MVEGSLFYRTGVDIGGWTSYHDHGYAQVLDYPTGKVAFVALFLLQISGKYLIGSDHLNHGMDQFAAYIAIMGILYNDCFATEVKIFPQHDRTQMLTSSPPYCNPCQ